MIKTVNESDFCDQFRVMGRLDNFSYEARVMLFDYLEECEEILGEEIEMDVISICCDFSEDSPETIADTYNIDISDCEGDEDEIKKTVLAYLQYHTTVVGESSYGMIVYATSF